MSLLAGIVVLLLPAVTALLAVGLQTQLARQCSSSANLGAAGRAAALAGVLVPVVLGYAALPAVLTFTSRIWDREGQRRRRVLLVATTTSAALTALYLLVTRPWC